MVFHICFSFDESYIQMASKGVKFVSLYLLFYSLSHQAALTWSKQHGLGFKINFHLQSK